MCTAKFIYELFLIGSASKTAMVCMAKAFSFPDHYRGGKTASQAHRYLCPLWPLENQFEHRADLKTFIRALPKIK